MKKWLLILLAIFICFILLGVLFVIFLICVSRNQVMDGPGMENKATVDGSAAGSAESAGSAGSGKKQFQFPGYDGTWYNRDKSVKLVIRNGYVKGYLRKDGSYSELFNRRARLGEDGYLYSADKNSERFGSYGSLEKRGNLLYGINAGFVTDMQQIPDEEFALEGQEKDFPSLPVYVKAAEEVGDRQLEHFSMNVGWRYPTETFAFAALEGFERAQEIYFYVSTGKNGGKTVNINAVDGNLQEIRQMEYDLSPAREQELAELLLSPEVLASNPYSGQDQMAAPTVSFLLDVEFQSGERIYINASQGILIGDEKALEIAKLLLGGQ